MDNDKIKHRKVFRGLPDELQEVVTSMKTIYDTRNIGKNSGLSQTQLDKIEIAVLYVLLGIEKPENLAQKLQGFEIDTTIAQKVSSEIDKLVFWPVRDLLAIARNNYKKIDGDSGAKAGTEEKRAVTEKTIASVLFARNNK